MQRLRKFLDNTSGVAIIIGIVGVFIIGFGFDYLYSDSENFTLRQFVTDLYANGGAELLSIAVTVLVIDGLNRRRLLQERKTQLFQQLKYPSNDFAVAALVRVQDEGLWEDALKHYRDKEGIIDLNGVQWAGGVNLQNVDLKGARLRNANLDGANLMQANLEAAKISHASFVGANFSSANLDAVVLRSANLSNANLVSAKLKSANLSGTNFEGAELLWANLEGADLSLTNLEGAKLNQANLGGVDLFEANLTNAKMLFVNLSGADLHKANISGVDFAGANLQFANLEGQFLSRVSFRGADLMNANFKLASVSFVAFPDGTETPEGRFAQETDIARFTDPEHPEYEATREKTNQQRTAMGLDPLN